MSWLNLFELTLTRATEALYAILYTLFLLRGEWLHARLILGFP